MVCWFALEFIVKDQTNFVMLALLILIGSCVLGQNVAAQEKIKFPVGVTMEEAEKEIEHCF